MFAKEMLTASASSGGLILKNRQGNFSQSDERRFGREVFSLSFSLLRFVSEGYSGSRASNPFQMRPDCLVIGVQLRHDQSLGISETEGF